MARINVEDQFFVEVVPLAIKMGDQDKAYGQVLRFWKLIQEKHKHHKYVTEDEFRSQGFSEHLFDFFAIRVAGGITAKGAEKHFDWLREKAEIGRLGGINSGKSRRSKTKQTEAKRSKPKQIEPSPSPSFSSSLSNSSSQDANCAENSAAPALTFDIEPALLKTADGVKLTGVSEFITLRRKLHLEIHGVEPMEGGMVNGILSRISKSVPRSEMPLLLEYFYKVPNNFYKIKGHDLKILQNDLAKLLTEVRRKKPIIPDGRAKTFDKALGSVARDEELERMMANRRGNT